MSPPPEPHELTGRLLDGIAAAHPDDPVEQWVLTYRLSKEIESGLRAELRRLGPAARARASLSELARRTGMHRERVRQLCGSIDPAEARRRQSAKKVE